MYLFFYLRPAVVYGARAASAPGSTAMHVAALCWTLHYAKRILETLFIHRFSHESMPLRNLFKNCAYYWGFAAWIAYYVNHPAYTPPPNAWLVAGAAGFFVCELGNLSIHLALRNLRSDGSRTRRIPYPTGNPFTLLFRYVSVPNYTYEIGSWLCFSLMTSTASALVFTVAGFVQMTEWAIKKHVNYRKEFPDYPKGRRAIVPFLL